LFGGERAFPNRYMENRFKGQSFAQLFRTFESEYFAKSSDFPFRDEFISTVLEESDTVLAVEVSAWMLREFLQKRNFCSGKDDCNWNGEMEEMNCRFNVADFQCWTESAGFIGHEHLYSWTEPKNFVELHPAEEIVISRASIVDDGSNSSAVLTPGEIKACLPAHVGGLVWKPARLDQ